MNKPRILLFLSLCAVLPCSAQTNPIDSLSNLDEVVVTGYRTISRERAAGSYDIVSSKEVEKRHTLSTSAIFDGIPSFAAVCTINSIKVVKYQQISAK